MVETVPLELASRMAGVVSVGIGAGWRMGGPPFSLRSEKRPLIACRYAAFVREAEVGRDALELAYRLLNTHIHLLVVVR